MKSEPEPRGSRRERLGAASPAARPGAPKATVAASERGRATLIPFSGSVTSRATWLTKVSSVCEPPAPKKPRAVAVGVDVDGGVLAQLVGVGLGPLGRAEQARLLAVPGGVDDGALRASSRSWRARPAARASAQLGHHAAERVGGAVDPGVVMVAADHPLVGPLGAGDAGDHVVDRLQVPVERQLEVDLRRAGAEVVGDRQAAAPVLGRHRAGHRLEQRQGVAVGDRQHGDLGQRRRVLEVEPLGVLGGADARGERIARVGRHVGHRAALDAAGRSGIRPWGRRRPGSSRRPRDRR